MRITIDETLCSGHGRCYSLAPDVFSPDEDGFSLHRGQVIEVAPANEESARAGINACPEGAIKIV